MGLVDTKLVGGLGAAALGGVGMATVLTWLSVSFVFGLMRGVKVRTAYALAQGRPADGIRYAQAGLLLGAGVGVIVFFLCRDVTGVLEALGVDKSSIPYARDFLAARTVGAVATCGLAALVQYRQGTGDSHTPMIIGIGGNVVNGVLAYGLIYGHFGLPALGVRGAGYATSFTEALELAVMLRMLLRDMKRARALPGHEPIPLRTAIREVSDLGVPTGLHFGLETLAFTTFNAVLAGIAATEIAASHIALNVLRASFLPGVAIGEAASVLVARSLAVRRLDEADRVVKNSLVMSVSFMGACGVVFALFGGKIAAQFSPDRQVIAIAHRLFFVAAVFQMLDAANMVLRCSLRGAKDVRWVAVVGTTIAWASFPSAAFVLGRVAGLGAFGGWLGFIVETSLGSAFMWWRWSKGPWRGDFTAASTDRRDSVSGGARAASPLPAPGAA
jgi:multidrug resistance protein, MATE family